MDATQHHGIYFYIGWALGPGAGIFGAIWWVVNKLLVTPVKQAYAEGMERLKHIETVTNVATENHLTTIETNSKKTVEVLEKIHDGQLEMSGYIKAMVDRK
jgi:hypothetical protein